ncbi:MAG TPA: VanW family protein [Patescibacteria group bacterium]
MKKTQIPHFKIFNLKKYKHLFLYIKSFYWFGIGAILGLFFLISFTFIVFQQLYKTTVFPGVTIDGVNFGGKSELYILNYFNQKNKIIQNSNFTIVVGDNIATISAKDIQAGYDSSLLAQQAMSVGRSGDIFSNISLVFQSYLRGIPLSPAYYFSDSLLRDKLSDLEKAVGSKPLDAVFQFENGRVVTFKPSSSGTQLDIDLIEHDIQDRLAYLTTTDKSQSFIFNVPAKIIQPHITTNDANNLGIKELIGTGTSLFQHSIASRIYNVELAASRLNGILVAPNEEFSFDKSLGDVSAYTGYQQAYVIANGHTVLGDGGGVCQVSTTLFRAILNAGLPITERHAHDYRVGYYEEDSPPGIDATVYVPTVDLKFKNDTGHYILIQSVVDPSTLRLTFNLYGVSDGRQVTMTTPVVTGQTPAPAPLYQDDPTLPKGVTKQIDFSAAGAHVSFSRTVTKNGKEIINDTFISNYRPWQAVYLVGTQ